MGAAPVVYVRRSGKTLLDVPVARALQKALRAGATEAGAARAAGISARTFRRWLALGHTEVSGPHRSLLLGCQSAHAAYNRKLAEHIGEE